MSNVKIQMLNNNRLPAFPSPYHSESFTLCHSEPSEESYCSVQGKLPRRISILRRPFAPLRVTGSVNGHQISKTIFSFVIWILSFDIWILVSVCLAGSVARLPVAGSPAPDFSLKGLNAKDVALRDYRGKVVLLNFWATWCVPCRKEMPSMERIYGDYKDQGFEILAISIDKKESKVKSFMEEYKFTFTVPLDSSHKIREVYGISSIPKSFLIDRKGVIDRVIFGAYDWESFLSRRIIEDLLINRLSFK